MDWPALAIRDADAIQSEPCVRRDTELPIRQPVGGGVKRCLDLFLTALLLPPAVILSLPLVFLMMLDGGKPIYAHLRVGWNGRLFRCYKFRTMVVHADAVLGTLLRQDHIARKEWLERYKLENDPRVTRLGWFLRRTNLDEIPQLWNVLKGEMSWVGPRPVIPEELSMYGAQLESYLVCRPGVTGIWQVSRRNDTPYSARVALDAQYARTWSFASDLKILLVTIPRIVAANIRPSTKDSPPGGPLP